MTYPSRHVIVKIMDRLPVVIVGAGLAGLVAARELSRAGSRAASSRPPRAPVGGSRRSRSADGRTAEAHMEEYWSGKPSVRAAPRARPCPESRQRGALRGRPGRTALPVRRLRWPRRRPRRGLLRHGGRRIPAVRRAGHSHSQESRPRREAAERPRGPVVRLVRRASGSPATGHGVDPRRRGVRDSRRMGLDRGGGRRGRTAALPHPRGFGEVNAHVVGGNERFVEALVGNGPTARCGPANRSPTCAMPGVTSTRRTAKGR